VTDEALPAIDVIQMLVLSHSYYSLQTGVRGPQDLAEAAARLGYEALAVTDINGMYGAVHAYHAIREAGLKPLVGAELSINADSRFCVLVKSVEGYRQLCRLLSAFHLNPMFDWGKAVSGMTELIFLSRSGFAYYQLREVVPKENLYVLCEDEDGLWGTGPGPARQAGLPDCWFVEEQDRETFADLAVLRRCRSPGEKIVLSDRPVMMERATWATRHTDYERVACEIVDACTFEFDLGVCHLPELPLPVNETAVSRLTALCHSRLGEVYDRQTVDLAGRRLQRELDVIIANGFAGYFLYVNEIVGFARQRNIPVEVRGSAASSIVSYLLEFTHCCPLEYDLYFERFLNPGRKDCPDIDVDIADNRRDEVIQYCYDRWGEDHVAMIATVQRYRSRGALRDAGRILGISADDMARFIKFGTPFAESARVREIADRLTGLPRHLGVHCGGVIITPFPLTDIAPLFRSAKGVVTLHYEKDQAEMLGLVKMDLLGNSALSVIAEGKRLLASRGIMLKEEGPAYDYKVNRLFANGDTLGVYQCESPGMRQMCRAIRPCSKKAVAMALSLIRPGPAAAGMKDVFLRRLKGLAPVTYLHPRMADFLAGTFGVMLYQEDVMKVAVELAGYSMAEADNLRRAVKGKGDDLFACEKGRFLDEKAVEAGIPRRVAQQVWDHVTQFASYSFCKAHASVYGRLAWVTARLKAHYPAEFYTAVLNCHQSMYPKRVFVWDAIRHGIPVLPPDVCLSLIPWSPTRKGIRAGLACIGGLRQKIQQRIISHREVRPFRYFDDFRERVRPRRDELEKLILIGACRAFGSRKDLLSVLDRDGCGKSQGLLFERPIRTSGPRGGGRLPPLIRVELTLTGIPFSLHPVEILGRDIVSAKDMPAKVNRRVSMFGILDAVKHTRAKSTTGEKRRMSFVTLEDPSGLFEAVLFPSQDERYGGLFKTVGPYLVTGTVKHQWDSLCLEVDEAVVCA
jgi:DNA polymerase III alpha subunit